MGINALDGKFDGKVTIRKDQGISQAIKDEFGLTDKQCKQIGKDGWESIFEEVQKNKPKQYTNGEDLSGDWHENYTVQEGTTIVFDKALWNKIVDIVNKKLNLNAAHIDKTADAEEPAAVEETEETQQQTVQDTTEVEAAEQDAPTEAKSSEPAKLTFGDWMTSLGNSAKDFLKGMVCDEDGKLSLKKIGIAAVTTAAAAIACTNPVGMMIVGGITAAGGLGLGVKGISNIVNGVKDIKAATTREEKLAALDQATDGIVETTVGIGMTAAGAKMMKTGYANYTAGKAPAASGEAPVEKPAPAEEPIVEEPVVEEPAVIEEAPVAERPTITEEPQPTAEEISLEHRRSIAENGSSNAQNTPSSTSKYNAAPENPTQQELVHQTQPENPGTFSDAKGGDKLAQLRDQVAAEEQALQNSPQGKAAQSYENASQRFADQPKGTKDNPLNAKQIGKKIKVQQSVEHAQSNLASTGANRTVTVDNPACGGQVKYTIKNNEIAQVEIVQGSGKNVQVLDTPIKIWKHISKFNIDVANLV